MSGSRREDACASSLAFMVGWGGFGILNSLANVLPRFRLTCTFFMRRVPEGEYRHGWQWRHYIAGVVRGAADNSLAAPLILGRCTCWIAPRQTVSAASDASATREGRTGGDRSDAIYGHYPGAGVPVPESVVTSALQSEHPSRCDVRVSVAERRHPEISGLGASRRSCSPCKRSLV
jgi:hypothetical protein